MLNSPLLYVVSDQSITHLPLRFVFNQHVMKFIFSTYLTERKEMSSHDIQNKSSV